MVLCEGARQKYRFSNHIRCLRVVTLCVVLHIALIGFYAWLHNPVSECDKDYLRVLTFIRNLYARDGGM